MFLDGRHVEGNGGESQRDFTDRQLVCERHLYVIGGLPVLLYIGVFASTSLFVCFLSKRGEREKKKLNLHTKKVNFSYRRPLLVVGGIGRH